MAYPPPLWPSRLFDQNFGMCICPSDFLFPFYNSYSNYYKPWGFSAQHAVKDVGSTVNNEKESFKVTLDVQHFRPNELSVKVANNQIIIDGKHEERKDEHGFVSRHFTRRYALPSNCSAEDVISNLSSDGVLTIVASKFKEFPINEKIVPITLCKSRDLKEETVIKSVINKDQNKSEVRNVDANKKNTQIMLKEDHCSLLLKPELLRETVSDGSEPIVEKKKDKLEFEKCKISQASKNTSEMLAQTFALASSTASASGGKCDKIMSKSELEKVDKSKAISGSDEKNSTNTAMSTSEQRTEQSFAQSNLKMSESDEKFDLFDTMTTPKSTDEILKSSAAMSTLSEKTDQSRITKSEMSELTSMSTKTVESIESSSSFKASMTSNITEISEELSDFVSDILLDKTLEIKK